MVDESPATTLLVKLGTFARALEPAERRLFAALIGPGIEQAIGAADVEGFAAPAPESDRLVQALAVLAGRVQRAVEGTATDVEGGAGE